MNGNYQTSADKPTIRISKLSFTLLQISILVLALLVPFLIGQHVNAAQITFRSATIDKPSASSTNIQFAFGYTLPAAAAVLSVTYEFCTTPLGTCTVPDATFDARTSTTQVGQTGTNYGGAAFTPKNTTADSGACLQATGAGTGRSFACSTRASGTGGASAVTHTIAGVVGPAINGTVYVRIATFSGAAYTGALDNGTVAVSFNQRLTINARVQESLTFCVGTTVTNAIGANGVTPIVNGSAANVTSCTNADGTSIDLGVISSTASSISPVPASPSGGDARNAYIMLLTNAFNGAVVSYRSVQDGATSGRLKVPTISCSGSSGLDAGSGSNDQCFNSSTTQTVLAAGTEEFGMTIGGVSCFAVPTAGSGGYTCDYTTGAVNLRPVTGYIGGTFVATTSGTYGTGTGFAWQSTGAAITIASTTGATKVVSNEALLLRFGATAATTTPTGSYTTLVDFIATPTF